jgi:hypothetical protein
VTTAAAEYAAQRDRLVALVESVPNIGRVHNRLRYGDAADHWLTEIDGVAQVRAWEVSLDDGGQTTQVDRITSGGHRHFYRPWLIRGWISIIDSDEDDVTYPIAVTLAHQIADAIDADPTLAGTCLFTHGADGRDCCQVGDPKPITLGGGIFCWAVEIRLTAYTVIGPI